MGQEREPVVAIALSVRDGHEEEVELRKFDPRAMAAHKAALAAGTSRPWTSFRWGGESWMVFILTSREDLERARPLLEGYESYPRILEIAAELGWIPGEDPQ
jgi:hypothetical protein